MVAFYIMLARPVGRFFTVRQMNFPVMLIASDLYRILASGGVLQLLGVHNKCEISNFV